MAQAPVEVEPADEEAAFEKAVRILAAAAQTEVGLTRRLARAGYDEKTVEGVCRRLRRLRYLDDGAFAASRVRMRQEQGRGRKLIAAELRQKGVSSAAIDEALGSADPDQELAQAARVAGRLAARYREDPARARRGVMSALIRRGYSFATAREACSRALGDEQR